MVARLLLVVLVGSLVTPAWAEEAPADPAPVVPGSAPAQAAPAAAVAPVSAAPVVEAPAAPIRPGSMALQFLVAAPTHLAATGLLLTGACSGEVIDVRCGRSVDGSGGALTATALALAFLPPLASGSVVWGLAGGDGWSPSWLWTVGAGAAGGLAGFGLALATGEPTVGLLSLTAIPAVAEIAAAQLTQAPTGKVAPLVSEAAPLLPELAFDRPGPRAALLLPVGGFSF